MALKLEINFDVKVKIIENDGPDLTEQIQIVCEPFANGKTYKGESVPDFTQVSNQLLLVILLHITHNFKFKTQIHLAYFCF